MIARGVGLGWVVALVLVGGGCGADEDPLDGAAPTLVQEVVTTFHPSTWLALRLLGDEVPVRCIAEMGSDPAHGRPSVSVIAGLQRSRLVVINGAGLESWTTTVSLPRSRVVDLSAAFSDQWLRVSMGTHTHVGAGEHTHEGSDYHVWMDPDLMARQAEVLASAVSRAWPHHAESVGQRLAGVQRDLQALNRGWEELSPPLERVVLLASHPAYEYLARAHGWNIKSFDIDPGAPLNDGPRTLLRIATQGVGDKKAVLLWEAEPLPELRSEVDRLGIVSVVLSPGAMVSEELGGPAAWLALMEANVASLRAALPP